MHKLFLAVSSAALAMAAASAAATIQIFITPGAVQPAENVQFQGQAPTGNNAFGVTKQTGKKVTFVGSEPLATPSRGQARVEAADGGLSQFRIGSLLHHRRNQRYQQRQGQPGWVGMPHCRIDAAPALERM